MAEDLWLTMGGLSPPDVLPGPSPAHPELTPARGTPEYGRSAWEWSEPLSSLCPGCEAYPEHWNCWGWDIVRISYLDDAKFARAVRAVSQLGEVYISTEPERHLENVRKARAKGRYRRYGPDTGEAPTISREPNDMMRRHYHHSVVQDKSGLEGASPDEAREYLLARGWGQGKDIPRGTRSMCFLYMDEENIEHLAGAALPGEEGGPVTIRQKVKAAVLHWVKVVDVLAPPSEERQHRLRLYDLLEVFLLALEGLHRLPTSKATDDDDNENEEGMAETETARDWPFIDNIYSGLEPRDVSQY